MKAKDMLLNNKRVNNETKEESKRYLEMKRQHPQIYGIQQSSTKTKCIVSQAYLKKQEKSQINSLTLHLK